MTIGERLYQLRGKKSLGVLGGELGVSAQQLSRIENDKSAPSLELATKICEYFGVTMDWLIRGIEAESLNVSLPQEPSTDYVMITKDELLKLQRMALDKTEKELDEKSRQVERLKNAG